MKNLKKVLALVVVFAMMASTVVFAGSFKDVTDDATYAGAVETLSALGYFKGDDNGNFNPDATITRAEYATIVCRLLGIADSATGKADFTDVAADHWATGYIKMANQYGIVLGYGDGKFGPEDPVKYEEAIKMLVCALGYEPMAVSKGGWPTGYVAVASQIGLLEGITGAKEGTGAARSLVAVMTYNALDIPVMEQMGFGTQISYEIMKETEDHDKSTILTKAGIYKLGGVVRANSKTAIIDVDPTDKGNIYFEITEDYDCPESKLRTSIKDGEVVSNFKTFSVGATKAEDFVGTKAIVYVTKLSASKYEIAAIEVDSSTVDSMTIKASTLADDLAWNDAEKPYIRYYKDGVVTGTGTKLSLDKGYTARWNNTEVTAATLNSDLDADTSATIELIDLNDNGKYDVVKVYSYAHLIAESVEEDKGIIKTYNDVNVNIDIENEDAKVTIKDVNGNELSLKDIKDGDVLALVIAGVDVYNPSVKVVKNPDNYTSLEITVLKDSTVTGAVTEMDAAEGVYTIDKKDYKLAADDGFIYNHGKVGLQAEGKFFIGINGEIVGFEGEKVSSDNYAFIMSAYADSRDNLEIELLTKDGKIATYDVNNNVKLVATNGDKYKVALNKNVEDNTDFATAIAGTAWKDNVGKNGKITLADAIGGKDNGVFFATLDTIDGTDAQLLARKLRLVTVKLNSNNEIIEITPAAAGESDAEKVELGFDVLDSLTEYSVSGQKLSKNYIADDVVVFDIDFDTPSLSKVADLKYFVDGTEYTALLYNKDVEGNYGLVVITSDDSTFAEGAGLAIVQSKKSILDAEENEVSKVVAYKDGETVELVFDDDSTAVDSKTTADKFDIGTVFEYVADANGVVVEYRVIGNVAISGEAKTFAFDADFAKSTDPIVGDFVDGEAYFVGYLTMVSKNEANIEIALTDKVSDKAETGFTVSKANQYTLTGRGDTTKVSVGSYTNGSVEAYDAGDAGYYYVIIKTFEEEVVDIIALDYANPVVVSYTATVADGSYADLAAVKAAEVALKKTETVAGKDTTETLEKGTDYTVEYSEVKDGKVTVSFKVGKTVVDTVVVTLS